MMRKYLIILLFCFANHLIAQQKRPNIIIVFMDDMGYGDVSVNGALSYQTPVLDKMASTGLRFTNFLTPQATCTASRAALLTGNYPNRMNMFGAFGPNSGIGLHEDEVTIAEMLKSMGYSTHMIGKWHLGNEPQFLPTRQGFDSYLGLPYSNDMWPVEYDGSPARPGGRVAHYPVLPLLTITKEKMIPDTVQKIETLADQAELTKLYTEDAIKYIRSNKNKPFFLYMAHSMTHVPIAASKAFAGKSKQGLFGDVMMEIDWSMQQLFETLKSAKIDDNTIVIFTSDNGPWLNFGNHNGNAAGFKEGKGTSWEGGVRVPCFVSWPSVIKEGKVVNHLTSSIDIFATIADVVKYSEHPYKIDGVSFLPYFNGSLEESIRKEFYYYYNRNDLEAVRKDNWKLVLPHKYRSYENINPADDGFGGKYAQGETKGMELYDLRRDPGERYNVIEMYPETVQELLQVAEKARMDLGDNLTNREGRNRRPIGVKEK
ncbi:arylsulfatase [Sphingobacterium nematocida]|uniref:Arylsulfatase n=1 Tax=Sphingobacterium nematocida TaxID=1513896 RepID=A0A1T5FLH4_9SPHI|nr:sulfatase [Sphingobacterium nematocida]SKB96936.1 arylsulfatase [Sphingobacterium nematocida]